MNHVRSPCLTVRSVNRLNAQSVGSCTCAFVNYNREKESALRERKTDRQTDRQTECSSSSCSVRPACLCLNTIWRNQGGRRVESVFSISTACLCTPHTASRGTCLPCRHSGGPSQPRRKVSSRQSKWARARTSCTCRSVRVTRDWSSA